MSIKFIEHASTDNNILFRSAYSETADICLNAVLIQCLFRTTTSKLYAK